jgi:rod shape-determining protein MreD
MRLPIDSRPPYGLMVWAVISILLSLIFYSAPLRIANGPDLMPMLPLITLFIWSTVRPRFIPPIVIFIVGLLNDVLTGGVLGIWALAYLTALTIARSRDEDGPTREFGPVWIRFIVVLAIAMPVAWGAGSLAIGQLAPVRPLLIESVASGLMFPLLALLFIRRRNLRGAFGS